MGKVILGAILGAGVGLLIGWLPSYDYSWEIVQPERGFTLSLGRLLHPLSMMIWSAAGGIIGAIAGRVAADPNSAPLPRWVRVALLVLSGIVLILGFIVAGVRLLLSTARQTKEQSSSEPAHEQRAPNTKPAEEKQPPQSGVP